jgi:hypothetical protein
MARIFEKNLRYFTKKAGFGVFIGRRLAVGLLSLVFSRRMLLK